MWGRRGGGLASEHEAALNGRTSNSISLYKRLRLAKKAEKKQTKHAKTMKQIPTTLGDTLHKSIGTAIFRIYVYI